MGVFASRRWSNSNIRVRGQVGSERQIHFTGRKIKKAGVTPAFSLSK
jgi:hypothetical protein